jgi:hypothetical protein
MKAIFLAYARPYSKVDPARRQEAADSQMIYEDYSAAANLSPRPIIREFPRSEQFNNAWPHYDDMYGGN